MNSKITYALTGRDRIVHIDEAERGAACGCRCPGCGGALVARKGDETEHHFAHADGGDCEHGFRSSLYCAIYRQLDDMRCIVLPPFVRNRSLVEEGSGVHVLTPQARVRVDRLEFTRKTGGITGIILYCKDKPLLLRLLTEYTSAARKSQTQAKLRALGLPVIEIDLSREEKLGDTDIKRLLTTAPPQLYWVYNARAEGIWLQLLEKCDKLPVEGRDNAIYTLGCPEPKRRTDGVYCYLKAACARCEYFFGLYGFEEERYLRCGRRQAVTEAADLSLSLEERKKKYGIKW